MRGKVFANNVDFSLWGNYMQPFVFHIELTCHFLSTLCLGSFWLSLWKNNFKLLNCNLGHFWNYFLSIASYYYYFSLSVSYWYGNLYRPIPIPIRHFPYDTTRLVILLDIPVPLFPCFLWNPGNIRHAFMPRYKKCLILMN